MSTQNFSMVILPGDGIGPEVMDEVKKLASWLAQNSDISFDITEDLVGGAAIDAHGTSLTDETLEKCKAADAVLLGAVGGPKWDNVDYNIRPEAGLLKLRKEMDLFANLRPAIVFDALIDASVTSSRHRRPDSMTLAFSHEQTLLPRLRASSKATRATR